MGKLLLLVAALAASASAARVTGTVYDARGVRASGSIVIEWSGFTTSGGKVVAPGRRTVWVVSGTVDVTLDETAGASPAGTAYLVTYRVAGYAGASVERWEVPLGVSSLASVRRPAGALPAAVTTALFVDAEVPGGLVNGANTTFVLSAAPNPVASLILVRNGVVLRRNIDYGLSGSTVTFLAGAIPQDGDLLQAWYRY